MKKKILITGCSGFLAHHLIDKINQNNQENPPVISGLTEIQDFVDPANRQQVYHVDITDRELLFSTIEKIKPDLVFHFAAIANVGFSWTHQKLTYEVNFIGSSNLLEALHTHVPQCRLVVMSTAELYGNTKLTPYSESDGLCTPKNPYALSKMAMEMLTDLYIDARGMDIVKVRSFNFTGPAQDRKFVASDFSYQIARIEKGLQEPVIHVGNLSAVRDLSDVRDISRYLTVFAESGKSGGIYNACSGNTASIQQVLDTLLSFSTKEIEIKVDQNKLRPIDVPVLWGNNALIKENFGLYPQYSLEQTLKDLLNYWRERIEA